jgi:hypothetical protein
VFEAVQGLLAYSKSKVDTSKESLLRKHTFRCMLSFVRPI